MLVRLLAAPHDDGLRYPIAIQKMEVRVLDMSQKDRGSRPLVRRLIWVGGAAAALLLVALYVYYMLIDPIVGGPLGYGAASWQWRLREVASEWQTFNAGMVALFAAIIGALAALYVGKASEREKEIERRRKANAARIVMVFPMSELLGYLKYAAGNYLRHGARNILEIKPTPPFPREIVSRMELIASLADDVVLQEYIGVFCERLSVAVSRFDRGLLSIAPEYEAISIADVYVMGEVLLDYGLSKKDEFSPLGIDWECYKNALRVIGWVADEKAMQIFNSRCDGLDSSGYLK